MRKWVRLLFIRLEMEKIEQKMGASPLWESYCKDEEWALETMKRLQEQFNALYREREDLQRDE